MKVLERKKPEEIADRLIEKDREIGGDFYDRVSKEMRQGGYDLSDSNMRDKIVTTFLNRR